MSDESVPATTQAAAPAAVAESAPAEKAAEPKQEAQQTAAEKKEEARKYKLKINGREAEFDEQAVIALAQKGQASDERFKQAAAERKRIESVINRFKDDPDAAIEALLGKPAEELYKERLAKKLEELAKTPEQLEAEKLRKELDAYKKKETAAQEAKRKEFEAQQEQQYHDYYNKAFPNAISKVGLPATAETLSSMAQILLDAEEHGVEMPIETAAQLVKQKYQTLTEKFIKNADPERLYELLGEDFIRKISGVASKKIPQSVTYNPVIAKKDGDDEKKPSGFISLSELHDRAIKFK